MIAMAGRIMKWSPSYTVWGIGFGQASEVMEGLAETMTKKDDVGRSAKGKSARTESAYMTPDEFSEAFQGF